MELHARKRKAHTSRSSNGFPLSRGEAVSSYRWLASGVGFGRPNFAAVSPYHIVGSRQVLLLGAPFGGGFVLPHCRSALDVAFGRPNFAAVSSYHIVGSRQVLLLDAPFGGGFVLSFPRCALGVGLGRYPD